VRGFCNKGITNPHGVFSGIARHNIYSAVSVKHSHAIQILSLTLIEQISSRYVLLIRSSDVSEKHDASIFRVEEKTECL
jgi:hypothetical protein